MIIDFGVEADAEGQEIPDPEGGLCPGGRPKANGLQVLESVADVRTENLGFGPLLCGIDGYPAEGLRRRA